MSKITLLKKWWIAIAALLVIVIVLIVWVVISGDNRTSDTGLVNISDNTVAQKDILPTTTFKNGLGSWYEEVWYQPASSGGEVTTGSDGVTFTGVQANSKSGIMISLNQDVSSYSKVQVNVDGTVNEQTLPGTGLNGREAPVAIAVEYKSIDGVNHNLLGEDPSASGQMFWRGFYFMDSGSGYGITNGVKVTQNLPFSYSFDLMTLNPKPKTIESVSLEGAGWKTRVGSVSSISITAK